MRRRLFFDIETSYCIGKFWRPGNRLRITSDAIIKHAAIICICYKWEGEKEIHSLTWDRKQDDKGMLKKFIEIANMATELVAHNGDKFDLRWIRTRCLFHRIPLFPDYTTIDTLKGARTKFLFPDNKLNTIGKYLSVGQKVKNEEGLLDKVILNKCQKSLEKMVKYCKGDVKLLEDVFNELSAHLKPKVHFGVSVGEDRCSCPNCGSYDHVKVRINTTATGYERRQLQCNTCHHHFTTSKDYYDKNINKFV